MEELIQMTTLQPLDSHQEVSLMVFFERHPEKEFDSGENIVQAGEDAPVILVVRGRVAQYYISNRGDKLSINIYQAGDLLPLSESIINLPSRFYIEAVEKSIVKLIPRSNFHELLRTNPNVLSEVLQQSSRDNYDTMIRLAVSMEGSAESRIFQELLIVLGRAGEESGKICITEANLASRTGLARETVNRTLKRLAMKGLIRRPSRGCIELV